MADLFQRSIDVIRENQSPTGAYPASPNFATYRYSWFRDGAFIAFAMDLAGEHESAHLFHRWAATVVNTRAPLVRRAVSKAKRDQPLGKDDVLDTRYLLDGRPGEEEWPNFQLDGFGTWLWSLGQHRQLTKKPLTAELLEAADLVASYLGALWRRPCYDCWEEFPDQIHTHTLATIYAGLGSHAQFRNTNHEPLLREIKRFVCREGSLDGHFVKYAGSSVVDASLLGLAVPYRVVDPSDPLIVATVERIEATLGQQGGIHRYAADTYYGGGAWILLTAWLGWYYVWSGDLKRAQAALEWVEAQADEQGNLPEQVPDALSDLDSYETWRQRWGEVASPLLWSHAKYVILYLATRDGSVVPSESP